MGIGEGGREYSAIYSVLPVPAHKQDTHRMSGTETSQQPDNSTVHMEDCEDTDDEDIVLNNNNVHHGNHNNNNNNTIFEKFGDRRPLNIQA